MTITLLGRPAPIHDEATRRQFLIGGASLAALLAGCGAPDAEAPPPSSSDDGRFPRIVAHKYGSTEIPAEPQRVVTVGLSDHDYVLALGVVPVGLTDWYGDYPNGTWPWAADELGDAQPEVMPRNEDRINFEQVAALRPDLVLGQYSGMTESDYALLSQIAPTVAQSAEFPDYGMPWEETTRVVGAALGQSERAEELIDGVEARFAATRAAHSQFQGLAAVVAEQFEPGTYVVRGPTDPRTRFLTALGFVLPDEIAQLTGDRGEADISAEQIGLVDQDLVLWNVGFTPELPAVLASDPLYQGLTVAREGRDVFLADKVLSGALTWSTVLSCRWRSTGSPPCSPPPSTATRPRRCRHDHHAARTRR
ncbi:MAG: iron-siderophore ABC transporter substrate-binding protein [Pseudonocardiaceae bacterium]